LISSVHDATGDLPDWSLVQKVLLVRLRSIGDTVLMTPCLEAIKSLRSAIEITVISEALSAPILEDHPFVDHLLLTSSSLGSRAGLIKNLRRQHFDVAFDLHGGTTASIIAGLSGAKYTIGYQGYRYSRLLNRRAPAPDTLLNRATVHSVEQQLALLNWTGLTVPEAPPGLSLQVTDQARQQVCERLHAIDMYPAESAPPATAKRFAIIAPAAAFETKRWSSNRFARVVNHLHEKWHLPCIVIAGREQEEIAHKVASLSTAKPRVVTGLSLKELMALISLSSLFVGNDSGPMHIAAAFDRPVIGIFGSSNPDVWHPWTKAPHRVVEAIANPAKQAHQKQNIEADTETRIRKIPVEAVNAAIDDVLQEVTVADFKRLAISE
jgi:lipopolysaccharide heptosyltransferase II